MLPPPYSPSHQFYNGCGLRQDDPLSPCNSTWYLRIFHKRCTWQRKMEILMLTLQGTTSWKAIFCLQWHCVLLSSKCEILTTIKNAITKFSFTRLQVNSTMSKLILSKACEYNAQFLGILCFAEGNLLFKYLGLPIIGRDIRTNDCNGLLEKL